MLVKPAPGRCHVSQVAGPKPCPGWFGTMIWVVKLETPVADLFLEWEVTWLLLVSLTDVFLTLKPTLSSGAASGRDLWCVSTDRLQWGG